MSGRESLIQALPHATHDVLEDIDAAHLDLVDEYLSHYVIQAAEARGRCPHCDAGYFCWGIAWGAGYCSRCDWPGRLYHVIVDASEDDSLVCSATCNGYRVCEATRGDHIPHDVHWHSTDGTSSIETELRCPNPTTPPGLSAPFTSRYHAPEIARFTMLLWAHPDFVVSRDG